MMMTETKITIDETVLMTVKRYGPCSSRQISNITDLPRETITKALYNLTIGQDALIKVAFIGPCAITGFRVKHYQFGNHNKNSNGAA